MPSGQLPTPWSSVSRPMGSISSPASAATPATCTSILAVAFAYSFVLVGFWGHTLGMAWMRLDAVDAVEGRTPIGPARAAIRSLSAGLLTIIPFTAFLDLLWPLWDNRNQTLHDKAAGTVVLRH